MQDTSGHMSSTPFAFFDPGASCWRTSEGTSTEGSTVYSGTWPKRGSMRSGACYAHPTWVPPTSVPGSSSLLPTPVARDAKGWEQPGRQGGKGLPNTLLPTPTRRDANGWRDGKNRQGAKSLPMLLVGESLDQPSSDGNEP